MYSLEDISSAFSKRSAYSRCNSLPPSSDSSAQSVQCSTAQCHPMCTRCTPCNLQAHDGQSHLSREVDRWWLASSVATFADACRDHNDGEGNPSDSQNYCTVGYSYSCKNKKQKRIKHTLLKAQMVVQHYAIISEVRSQRCIQKIIIRFDASFLHLSHS